MGQGSSDDNQEKFSQDFQMTHAYVKETKDPRFGEIQIFKNKNSDDYVLIKSIWCQSEEEFSNFQQIYSKSLSQNHKNLIKLLNYQHNSETQLCGDFSKITAYFEYFPHNLQIEIERRFTQQDYFTEVEIWFILESIVSLCSFFESMRTYHGDIRPINIFLTSAGLVKLADHQLLQQEKSNYVKTLLQGENTYLSPQQLTALIRKDQHPGISAQKADVFSLGMTMLEACSLQKSKQLYDYQNYRVFWDQVNKEIGIISAKYSQFLVKLIQEMIYEDENQRISFQEIQQILQPYQELIQNLQPFQPDQNIIQSNISINNNNGQFNYRTQGKLPNSAMAMGNYSSIQPISQDNFNSTQNKSDNNQFVQQQIISTPPNYKVMQFVPENQLEQNIQQPQQYYFQGQPIEIQNVHEESPNLQQQMQLVNQEVQQPNQLSSTLKSQIVVAPNLNERQNYQQQKIMGQRELIPVYQRTTSPLNVRSQYQTVQQGYQMRAVSPQQMQGIEQFQSTGNQNSGQIVYLSKQANVSPYRIVDTKIVKAQINDLGQASIQPQYNRQFIPQVQHQFSNTQGLNYRNYNTQEIDKLVTQALQNSQNTIQKHSQINNV